MSHAIVAAPFRGCHVGMGREGTAQMRQRRGAEGGVPACGWLLLAALGLATPWPAAAAGGARGGGAEVDARGAAAAAWTEHVRTPPAEPVLPPAAGPVSPANTTFSDAGDGDQDGAR